MAFAQKCLSTLGVFLITFTFSGCSVIEEVFPKKESHSNFIAGWGDSLTEGIGGTPYLVELEKLTGYQTFNGGKAGETSTQVAKRMLADKEKYSYNTIIWVGRNNYLEPEKIKADIASMVAALGHKRYLVLGIINGHFGGTNEQVFGAGHEAITKLNGELYEIYRDHYINIHTYLLSQYDPSLYTDIVDHTDDVIPGSLRSDELHLNTKGYQKVAERINQSFKVLTNQK
ncbi:SGNH/GDSL hydrolase family protein [Larkinella terrae]|uniref:SGNH/GDSL hydrolase family protein n=1 Tax=Larkinella terrae TaxID=2025311 RepID=A0A7K0EQ63_9BACT|nr:SGNH/GDSL hydrolase family protein [Larkinella terrae]MRS63975.1 hypothetical protein [Larkinella terrae]